MKDGKNKMTLIKDNLSSEEVLRAIVKLKKEYIVNHKTTKATACQELYDDILKLILCEK